MISTIDMMQNCRNMYLQVQQTPKPEAQFPSASPPDSLHSGPVRQRPLVFGSVTLVVPHSIFGKFRTEKMENDSEISIKIII